MPEFQKIYERARPLYVSRELFLPTVVSIDRPCPAATESLWPGSTVTRAAEHGSTVISGHAVNEAYRIADIARSLREVLCEVSS
jgi:hypothetical protein